MDFINCFLFSLMRNDRLQIKTESRFDSAVIHEMLCIRPIEVNAFSGIGDEITVSVSAPVGITVAKLTEQEMSANYFADIDNQAYHRLVLSIDEQSPGWFLDAKEVSTIEGLVTQPVVIKALIEDGKSPALLFAAGRDVSIMPVHNGKYRSAAFNPNIVPDAILRLVDIVDEQLPAERTSLELLAKRLNSTLKVLTRFKQKNLTLQAKEDCENAIGEVEDCIRKVDIAIEESRNSDPFEHQVYQKALAKLKQVVGAKPFEKIMSGIYNGIIDEQTKKNKADELISSGGICKQVLESIDDMGVHADVMRFLSYSMDKNFDACSCIKCGGNTKTYKPAGSKKYQVECVNCNETLSDEKSSANRVVTIANWNMENGPDDKSYWLAKFAISEENGKPAVEVVNKIMTVAMRMTNHINTKMPAEIKQSAEVLNLRATIEVLRFLSKVLK